MIDADLLTAPDRPAYAWLNTDSRAYLGRDYLVPKQTPEGRVRQIGETVERVLGLPGYADRFERNMSRGWYSLATPIWMNFGLDRGLPISCFGSWCDDSVKSILENHAEIGMMSKYGGGTSMWAGEIRGRGAGIRDGGKSFGSVHFAEMFDCGIRTISQASARRGECALWWPIDHPDVCGPDREVLRIRSNGHVIQKLSYGLCVPDAWMQSMIDGDRAKRELWAAVLTTRKNTGYPYLFFTDTVNRAAPKEYAALGLHINHSNLCVTGDQRVVSDRGLKTVRQLYEEGGALTIFDNDGPVKASPMKLIERGADVFKITLDNGMTHTVTGYHQVKVRTSPQGWPLKTADRRCDELKIGDLVAVQTNRGLFGSTHMPKEAFLLGLYHGDGTQTADVVAIDLWENDFYLVDEITESFAHVCNTYDLQRSAYNGRRYTIPSFADCTVSQSIVKKNRLIGAALKKFGFIKGHIPEWVWTGDEETQWQYVKGLLYTDGTVEVGASQGNPVQLSLASVDRSFLEKVQLIFANLGLRTSIRILREAGPVELPDGRGSTKAYNCRDCWRLIVGNKPDALEIERHTGFLSRKGVTIEDRPYRDNVKKFYSVVSVERVGKEDVYCCTVDSDNHHWVCNGVVTHNCTEICLANNLWESFVCCLSSMNALYADEWTRPGSDGVEVLVLLLEAVMTEFIEKARDLYMMHRAVRFAERQRALGLGVVGWHSYIQSKGLAFDEPAAYRENARVFKFINETAHRTSSELARRLGEPLYLEGSGRRHMTLTAVAPTKSSAWILGQMSEGINLYDSNYIIKDNQKGKFTFRNPFVARALRTYGADTPDTWASILDHGGSVQHIDCLSPTERAVYRTAMETPQLAVVQQAAQRQQFIDQGQSLNLTIGPEVTAKEINALLIEGWRSRVKTFYYHKNVNAASELAQDILTCKACEG